MTLEEKILKILLDNTDTEGRYVGGGHEPEIIVFKNSEDCDKDIFLSQIRDEIISELKPVMEEMKEALEEIDKPILFMHKRLKKGEQLNGQVAIELSKDDEYLKSIARKALSKYNELFKK